MLRRIVGTWAVSLLAAASPAAVPDGPYWSELQLPPGAGTAKAIGTTVTLQTPNQVYFWSGITRQWMSVNTSGFHTLNTFNAYAILEDGNTVYGFSSRAGGIDTLNLPNPPFVQHGPPFASWVSIAQLGNDVWGFSGFIGKWTHLPLQTSNVTVSIGSLAAVVHDGQTAYAFSAYHGTWVPISAPNAQVEANGVVVAANDTNGTTVRCFSAHTNQWATATFANPGSMITQRGYALFQNGSQILAFSGYKGSFASATLNDPNASSLQHRNVFVYLDGNTALAYSAGVGSFATRAFQNTPQAAIERDLAVVYDSTEMVGFSVVTGTFSAPIQGNFFPNVGRAVAFVDDFQGNAYAYSVVANTWVAAPVSGATAELIRNAVILIDNSGYHGFIGRTGHWVFQPSTAPFSYVVKNSGDTFVGIEGNTLHMFDPRIERWSSITTDLPPGVDLHRTVAIASDGVKAYGYGLMNNVWSVIPTQGSVQFVKASSSDGVVQTDTHLYAFTAHGSFSTLSRFPEFSRYQPMGTNIRLIEAAPTGTLVATILGFAPTYVDMGGLGTLFVDLTGAQIFFLGVVPAGDKLDLEIPVPEIPALNGVALHMQNYLVPPSGNPYLTNSIAPVFF